MQTIRESILKKGRDVLNIYFTAGYPGPEDTVEIIRLLEAHGADLIELGMPYSDPLADGQTIQRSSEKALKNGMNIRKLFSQVAQAVNTTSIPVIMMGYYNQMLQYGAESFVLDASAAGIRGMIIPDLPMEIFEQEYQSLFESCGMEISFLVTPLTSEERIRKAADLSSAFLYVVSQSAITGQQGAFSEDQIRYFQRIESMHLSTPVLIGFGIHNAETRAIACRHAHGVIIGSAFIRALEAEGSLEDKVENFMQSIR
ncbi:MAG: tryptophan synthase subunit alpha [Saprospiraceae bacterium]|nr:tryptophan synthase subunit alpha [Saprospiraceae bacterium]